MACNVALVAKPKVLDACKYMPVAAAVEPVTATVVNLPAAEVEAPMPVFSIVAPVNVPPVTVLPVKVNAVGRLKVGLPETPSPFVTVNSLEVPVNVLPTNVSAAV